MAPGLPHTHNAMLQLPYPVLTVDVETRSRPRKAHDFLDFVRFFVLFVPEAHLFGDFVRVRAGVGGGE